MTDQDATTSPGETPPDDPGPARRHEIATNVAAVRSRIRAACVRAGRADDDVTLVGVTKTYPVSDVAHLLAVGVADIGENRDQEAAAKAEAAAGLGARWHFIGQLQRNKCRSVVGYASMVHSVDGVRLAGALDRAASARRDEKLDVLVQVSIDGDPHRGGAMRAADDPDRDLERVIAAVSDSGGLRLRGVMAVAPMDCDSGGGVRRARNDRGADKTGPSGRESNLRRYES